jgi:hypothetical protein
MRNRVATLAAMTALALALGASPAIAATPAEHLWSIPAGGLAFDCGSTTITTASGTMDYVVRSADTASGNWSLTGTITLSGVGAVDSAGGTYRVIGSAHFGYSYNALTGVVLANIDGHDVSQAVTTFKMQLVGESGGLGGSLNFLQHGSPNGDYLELSAGSCNLN